MFSSWLVAFRNPLDIWEKHSSFLVVEVLFLIEGLITLCHALRSKGHWPYLWLSIYGHGIFVEAVCYAVPDIQNFWHAQATVMMLGRKLPLYVTFIYPVLMYTATVAAEKFQLSWWAKSFAAGLLTVLMDIPLDIIGVKLLWWTWHDTDPNVIERAYSVPWTSYYFHAAFTSALLLLFNGYRRLICGQYDISFLKMMICVLLTACTAMPTGILQFIPIYHLLHDKLHVHSEICVYVYLSACALLVWKNSMNNSRITNDDASFKDASAMLRYATISYFVGLRVIIFFAKPENIVSIGIHEPIGNCDVHVPVHTPLGDVLSKRKYLCLSDFNEDYYNFECLNGEQEQLNEGKTWYSICGTPFPDSYEILVVLGIICFYGAIIFSQLLNYKHSERSKLHLR